MKLPKERLAELLEERELSVTHVPVYHFPHSQTWQCYTPDGICTNPQRDCINCPKTYGQGTIITTTGT